MKKLLISVAAMPFLAGVAMAGQPKLLSDAQMDKVTAGQAGNTVEIELFYTFGGITTELQYVHTTGQDQPPTVESPVLPDVGSDPPAHLERLYIHEQTVIIVRGIPFEITNFRVINGS